MQLLKRSIRLLRGRPYRGCRRRDSSFCLWPEYGLHSSLRCCRCDICCQGRGGQGLILMAFPCCSSIESCLPHLLLDAILAYIHKGLACIFHVLIQCLHELPHRVRPASCHPFAGSSIVGYLVAVCLYSSAIAHGQTSRGLAAARAHVIVEVHVASHDIPNRSDVSLDGSVLLFHYRLCFLM